MLRDANKVAKIKLKDADNMAQVDQIRELKDKARRLKQSEANAKYFGKPKVIRRKKEDIKKSLLDMYGLLTELKKSLVKDDWTDKKVSEKKKQYSKINEPMQDPEKTNMNVAIKDQKYKKMMAKDEISKDDLDAKIRAKLKAEMDKRNFGEADATRHVIDRDRSNKMPKIKQEKPLLQSERDIEVAPEGSNNRKTYKDEFEKYEETIKYDKGGQWSLDKKEGRCWEGYKPTPGKKPYEKGSCMKKSLDVEIERAIYDDGVVEFTFGEDVPQDIEDVLVKGMLNNDYEELSKKDWAPKKGHKSDKGGLTATGRKSYNKATGGNLKAPQPGGGSRKRSFCARNKGQIDMHNIDCKKTPDKRACLARKRWKCTN